MKPLVAQTQQLFTSESVSPGHPDKICDQIADAILDQILLQDHHAKVACEVFITDKFLVIAGEVHSSAKVDYYSIAKQTLETIGYTADECGFNIHNPATQITVLMHKQSPDILQGVELKNHEIGAGDQGIMFGYACNETKSFMPLAIVLAHHLLEQAWTLLKAKKFPYALLDMKSQVTIDMNADNDKKIHTVLMSVQHQSDYNEASFKNFIVEQIMKPVAQAHGLNNDFQVLINPTGKFVIGGPQGDTGLTGRKIMVDTYGGFARHGGGAFSGKDPTKVDRSGAYFARYIAKNIVGAQLADKCEIQLAFAIGKSQPLAIYVNTFNSAATGISDEMITEIIKENFDCSIKGIISQLHLNHVKYQNLATFGHFGRDNLALPWENLDKVEVLKKYLSK